ncbi:methyl-accepting chemotaxis protein [Agaribacter flavus]|uniref:Methyl-accepting chemotaxis protein n=1 Tax=Agaribacter flavus TaxID=1902781 RepID=A0ABV7FSA5_9ALTE
MSKFNSLSIGARLGLGFGFILIMMLLVSIFGISKVNQIEDVLNRIAEQDSVKQKYAIALRGSVHDRAITLRDIVLTEDDDDLNKFLNEINILASDYAKAEKEINSLLNRGVFSEQERQMVTRISEVQASTLPLSELIIDQRRADDAELAKDLLLEEARPAFSDWLAAINAFIDYQDKEIAMATPVARKLANSFQSLILTATFIAIVASAVIGVVIVRALCQSLGAEPADAAKTISIISDGDLTQNIQSKTKGSMVSHISDMNKKLRDIVANIVQESGTLTEQSSALAHSSEVVTEAAKSQAQLTKQTNQSLAVMRERLLEVANIAQMTQENSVHTTDFSKQGKDTIQKGADEMELIAQTVNSTVDQVRRLEDTTKEIGNIVGVITSISEQTNLLALNAAIEAARAGESGRGFAVVADEVRQLAMRTGEATDQIENMIKQVQSETAASVQAMERTQPLVENGRSLTQETTNLLQEIESQANKSMENVQQVVAETSKQVASIEEITTSMAQIDDMSQQSINNLVENITATQRLDQISKKLRDNVSYFKL